MAERKHSIGASHTAAYYWSCRIYRMSSYASLPHCASLSESTTVKYCQNQNRKIAPRLQGALRQPIVAELFLSLDVTVCPLGRVNPAKYLVNSPKSFTVSIWISVVVHPESSFRLPLLTQYPLTSFSGFLSS